MSAIAEMIQPAAVARVPDAPAAGRLVTVVVDACCEIEPSVAADLDVLVLPREANVDGKAQLLDAQRTLHQSCWPQLPRRCIPAPYALGDLARAYARELDTGRSVLALHVPARLDGAARVALAARSILLAGQSGAHGEAPRIAIYELSAIGAGLASLVQAAANGAAAGMTLRQVLTLLDRANAALRSVYLTGIAGPIAHVRHPERLAGVARMGSEQLWSIDRASGLFSCRARGWGLSYKLFGQGEPLAGVAPTLVRSSHPQLLGRVNQGRERAGLAPLNAQTGGLNLASLFPRGCVELTVQPDPAHITHMIDVIRRIDQTTTPPARALRRQGGIA